VTLRKKTLGIVSLTLIILIATLYLISQYIVLGGFSRLEEQEAQRAVERVLSAKEESLNNLVATAQEWAASDEAYQFIEDSNEEYFKKNLLREDTFSGNRLNLVLFIRPDMTDPEQPAVKAVFAGAYDLSAEAPVPVTGSLASHISITSPLLLPADATTGISGILPLDEGPVLIAAEPILTSDRQGPARGTLILGRFLDELEIKRLARITRLSVAARPIPGPGDPPLPQDFYTAFTTLSAGNFSVAQALDDDRMAGYALDSDIYDKPALVWRADMPRSVSAQGEATVLYYFVILIAVSFVFMGGASILLEKLVLARVSDLSSRVISIGASGDLSERVTMEGGDELTTLGDSINGMLSALERAHSALQESEMRYRHMFIKNRAIKLVIDPESGQIVDANPAAAEFYACPPDLLLRMKITDISPFPAEQVMAAMARIAAEKSTYLQTRHRLASGDLRDVEFYASPVEIKGRRVLYSIIHDITERKRAQGLIQRHVERLAALRSIDMAISASLDLPVILNIILEQISSHLGIDAADVLLFNPQAGEMEYAAGQGFRTRAFETSRLRLGEGAIHRALLEQHIISIPALAEQTEFVAVPGLEEEGFVTYYAVPLAVKGQVNGVLEVFHRSPLHPDPEWLDFIEAVADQAAIAIDNATLFNDLQHSNEELARAYDSTLEGWSRALDLRDKETEGHSRRVTDLTLRLAQVVGVGPAELIHIRRGALLHDIGKMGIPDRILLKPGPLTDEERKIMQRHPTYAYELLAPIPFLRPALAIPYCHHERWDGTGYPRGLAGTAIPLAARIFAVVDVWDALTSDRPYRKAWHPDKVREHIRSLAGTHFDPEVVEAFLPLVADDYVLDTARTTRVQLIA
jgi:PAS domain S-box-containing protein